MSALYPQATGINNISPNQNQQYAFNNLDMPSAGVTATSKDGSSILNIHNTIIAQGVHHVPFFEIQNQVTEWAPVLQPIGASSIHNSLKNSFTLTNAIKTMDMIGVGNTALKDGENSSQKLASFSCFPEN